MHKVSSWFALFTSAGTLVCCALPSLLVVLGLGASLAGLISHVPQIVFLSTHKDIVFGLSGVMLTLSAVLNAKARSAPCPIDPDLRRACMSSRKWSNFILLFAVSIWGLGAFFAFLAPRLFGT